MQYVLQNYNIGKNLLRLRKSAGLTQEELIQELQLLGSIMSRDTYAKIEVGKRNIKVSDIVALKQFYHVTLEELFEGVKPSEIKE